jgi:3-oxoacyl-[acyl-carrier protein] reductase
MTQKVVLITGAQQGIGAACARAFATAGYDVAVNWLDNLPAAEAVAAEIRAAGRRALLLQGPVGGAAEATALVDATLAGLGRIDVLVNNAGIFPRVKFLEMTEQDWDQVQHVNLRGSVFCAQAAARAMIAAGHGGTIINLSSSSIRGNPLGVHYSASKNGIIGITRSMALALAANGITVNAIAPGTTDTAQPRYGNTDAELIEIAKTFPLGRMGTPAEIAALAVYLASEPAGWTTGQTYHINGGNLMV